MTEDQRLSPADLAKRWKVNVKTVYGIINRGEIPAFKIGGQYRVREVDADKYEEAYQTPLSKNPFNGAA